MRALNSCLWDKDEVGLAIEWFKRKINKDAIRLDDNSHVVRLEGVLELVERTFGDV